MGKEELVHFILSRMDMGLLLDFDDETHIKIMMEEFDKKENSAFIKEIKSTNLEEIEGIIKKYIPLVTERLNPYLDCLIWNDSTIDKNGKRKILTKIRKLLNEWENCVDSIGNEDAYSDSILDELPELVNMLMKITL